MTHRYITEVVRILNDTKYEGCIIYHNSSPLTPQKLANAVVLVCIFQVVILKRTAE
jgi:hypothetical protein